MLGDIVDLAKDYDKFISRYKAIHANQRHSKEKLALLQAEIVKLGDSIPEEISLVAVAGSYARHDASTSSDVDLMIFTPQGVANSHVDAFRGKVYDICEAQGMKKPNPKGVFSQPVSEKVMLEVSGNMNERYVDLSQRLLLLLESKAIWQPSTDTYEKLVGAIVDNYSGDISLSPDKNFVFLLNDIIRYFRTICVNYASTSKSQAEWGKWPIRNVKLRHSRVLMYFSLVSVVGALSKYHKNDKVDVLKLFIAMEPLKRLYCIYRYHEDTSFFRAAEFYNTFLYMLNNSDTREALNKFDYEQRYQIDEFSLLKSNSDGFAAEMLRFYEARRHQWSDRFFEYMII